MSGEPLPIVVIGGGGHAKVLLNVLTRLPDFSVVGYLDPEDRGRVCDFPWLGTDDSLVDLLRRYATLAAGIGIGKIKAGTHRLAILQRLVEAGCVVPAITAPTAVVAPDVVLSEGVVVFDGAIVQPGCRIGRAGIVNTGASVDHDCTLGDDVLIGPGAALGGGVSVGEGSVIGVGACCKQWVRIGAGCTIGAGAAVVSDCNEPGTYVGVPAQLVRP